MVTVSVIVPVYKCEDHIAVCIESILNQTMEDFKLILVDDGSPDRAPWICDSYAKKDPRVRVIHQQNGGVSSARNAGINASEGEFVTFIDSDDYVDRDYLQNLLSAMELHSVELAACGLSMETWSNGGITETVAYSFAGNRLYNTRQLLEGWGDEFPPICMCGPWCKLYRRDILMEHHIRFRTDMDCGEDTWFNLEYLERTGRIAVLGQGGYHYRRENSESLFSRFHSDTYEIHSRIHEKQYKLMERFSCTEDSFRKLTIQYFGLLLGGIHEYFRFYEKTTPDQKKVLMEKISEDPFVKKLRFNEITGNKKRLMYILLKAKWYSAINMIFCLRYKK